MYFLTIRGDNPEAEIGLYKNSEELGYVRWIAHRELAETLHIKIKALLEANNIDFNELSGIAIYKGPGSFTGLRISISVANALADSLNINIVGGSGINWIVESIQKLLKGSSDYLVTPDYGAPVHITQPKK